MMRRFHPRLLAALMAVALVGAMFAGGSLVLADEDDRKPGDFQEHRTHSLLSQLTFAWCDPGLVFDASRQMSNGIGLGVCTDFDERGCAWYAQTCTNAPGSCQHHQGVCSKNTPSNDAWCQGVHRAYPARCPEPNGWPVPQDSGAAGPADGPEEGGVPCPPGGCGGGGNLRSGPAPTSNWSAPSRPAPSRWSQGPARRGWRR